MTDVTELDGDVAPVDATRVLLIASNMIPSLVLGVLKPLSALVATGEAAYLLRRETQWTLADIVASDVVVFCRSQSWDAYQAALCARHLGKGIVFEIDDNFLECPISTPIGRYHREPRRLHVMRRLYELASVTRVYSGVMEAQAKQLGAHTQMAKAYFDAKSLDRAARRPRTDGVVRIALATGRPPDPQVDDILEQALNDVLDMYPGRIEVHFWRALPNSLKNRPNVHRHKPIVNYAAFIRSFAAMGFDIGLAPVTDTLFYASKTDNKYREYGGLGVAGIYSALAPYANVVCDGVNGVLVENTHDAWRDGLIHLIEDAGLRHRIAKAAKADVAANYDFGTFVEGWRRTLASAKSRVDRPTWWKPFYQNMVLRICLDKDTEFRTNMEFMRVRVVSPKPRDVADLVPIIDRSGKGLFSDQVSKGWLVVTYLQLSKHVELPTIEALMESGNVVVLDLRAMALELFKVTLDELETYKGGRLIVIACQEQCAWVGMPGAIAAEKAADYPSPKPVKAAYGYLVRTTHTDPRQADRHTLREKFGYYSINNEETLYFTICDLVATFDTSGILKPKPRTTWIYHRLMWLQSLTSKLLMWLQSLTSKLLRLNYYTVTGWLRARYEWVRWQRRGRSRSVKWPSNLGPEA